VLLPRSGRDVILSDTVGFISDLPTQLVEAFRVGARCARCAPPAGACQQGCLACREAEGVLGAGFEVHLSPLAPSLWPQASTLLPAALRSPPGRPRWRR
jgi:hypothetical protein